MGESIDKGMDKKTDNTKINEWTKSQRDQGMMDGLKEGLMDR